ncbi:nuclear transport factor 2 family protein [Actinophytocola sp.]|uniref:nuclear transport factor 2 family protein n=1 Tax=Actinophytocola sp. TaxID=1872138 RepID=UPI002ED45822
MSGTEKDVETITALERQRFDAVVAGDFDAFAAVAHPELMYTHSNGVTDTLESYMRKCRDGFYVYHQIDHPITKIVITGDVALVLGEMNADLTSGGTRKQLKNASLAVWVRAGDSWQLIAYQPTPRP